MNCEPKTVDGMADINMCIARANYMQAPQILILFQKGQGNKATRIQTVVHSMATLTYKPKCSSGYSGNLRWRIVTREKECVLAMKRWLETLAALPCGELSICFTELETLPKRHTILQTYHRS